MRNNDHGKNHVHTRSHVYGNEKSLNRRDPDKDDGKVVSYMKFYGIGHSTRRYTSWAVVILILIVLVLVYVPILKNVQSQRIAPIPGWTTNTTRDTVKYIHPHSNTTLIDPGHICSMTTQNNKIFLLIIVCSSSINFESRQSIRETWANTADFNYPQFSKIHKQFKGSYLNINYKDWQNYTMIQSDANDQPKHVIPIKTNDDLHSKLPNKSSFNVKVLFLIGQPSDNAIQIRIKNESDNYGDVIQESFLDTYNNLTIKSIMMLKWWNTNCMDKVKYLMKCDDDTFVNVPNLLHTLLGGTIPVYDATVQEFNQLTIKTTAPINRLKQQDNNLLIGSKFYYVKPIENVTSKWYAPNYMYDGNIYPDYLSGTGYVMSSDVAVKLYNVSLTTPLFHLEDIYLTGICAKLANINPRHHHLFSYLGYKKPCELRGMITKHELTASEMHLAYDFVKNTSISCPKPDKYFSFYKFLKS